MLQHVMGDQDLLVARVIQQTGRDVDSITVDVITQFDHLAVLQRHVQAKARRAVGHGRTSPTAVQPPRDHGLHPQRGVHGGLR